MFARADVICSPTRFRGRSVIRGGSPLARREITCPRLPAVNLTQGHANSMEFPHFVEISRPGHTPLPFHAPPPNRIDYGRTSPPVRRSHSLRFAAPPVVAPAVAGTPAHRTSFPAAVLPPPPPPRLSWSSQRGRRAAGAATNARRTTRTTPWPARSRRARGGRARRAGCRGVCRAP